MVQKRPQDLAAFGNISGVGKAKLEKYGEVFLSVIKGVAA
jgi:ATP-dependent DNA helicase RecQ